MGGTDLLDRKAPNLREFSTRFLSWVESATLAGKSKAYYCNGWRLLSMTKIVGMRLYHITKDDVEGLSFNGSASNANCALRTLRRMLHKAEEWNLIGRVPKFKLLTEHGRRLRLDEDAEQKLLVAARVCNWKPSTFELFRHGHYPQPRPMSGHEWLALWYLRLNGYFTMPTFYAHGRHGPLTEVDVLGVRLPPSREFEDDPGLNISQDCIDIVFAEAKGKKIEALNGPWGSPEKGALDYVLKRDCPHTQLCRDTTHPGSP